MVRPPMLPDTRKTETVQARGTKAERERWEETAWRRRTTISEMVRDFLNGEARKELGPEDAPSSPASPVGSPKSRATSSASPSATKSASKPRRSASK